ncbi:DUF1592 domain-containing protein [Sandaracinus amylolyticus]|uniref:Cellulose-binding domain protein n=1 Tax=Sandaracinus amylolyticus TaxID=927083 RepID=A0A0F6SG44_9BACT|nr:DUF1592 domain-containing protein [Sandaracinus amylolyticus]AKF08049.1 Cellulose-binding domain protein [Sandaracinus amylolyticus]
MSAALPRPSLLLAAVLASACTGDLGGGPAGPSGSSPRPGPGGPGEPVACDTGIPQVAPAPLRRLTPLQYRNTVRDLLGDPGYTPNVDDEAPVITERGVRQLRDAAELAIARRSSWSREIFPCDTSGAANDACASEFIDTFGARAFRRPLDDDDRSALLDAYRNALANDLTFGEAMEIVLEVILQSPEVVYFEEHGAPGATDATRPLSQYEVASRLSYFLWNTTPDDTLLGAARDGSLDAAGLRAQAERLLDDPRAEETLQSFFWEWLQLGGGRLHHALESTSKDETLYPEYDAELQAAMRTELEALVRDTFARGGSFEDLLTTRRAYVNGPLAAVYGVDGPTSADDWQWVELDPTQRAGLLTRAAFLTVFSSATVQSPIRRGVFVVEEVFCVELGTPPPNASDVVVDGGDDGDGLRTVRQDVTARTTSGTCSSCHSLINPVGFAFEHYDGIGRHRTEELTTGLPLDASGVVAGTDVDGAVRDAVELSTRIATSARARACFSNRWLERALGRVPARLDTCSMERISERFRESGSMRELVLAIVESDAFRYVNVGEVTP